MSDPPKTSLDYAPPPAPPYSALAVASFACALVALIAIPALLVVGTLEPYALAPLDKLIAPTAPVAGLAALVLGLGALHQIGRQPTRYRGELAATFAVLIGLLFGLFGSLTGVLLLLRP